MTSPKPVAERPPQTIDPAEIANRLLAQNVKLIYAKLKREETLTPGEARILKEVAQGKGTDGYAKNWVELSHELGVSRRTIQNWRSVHKDCPVARADGRHDIGAWREWASRHGIEEVIEDSPSQLRAKQMLLQNEKLRFQLGIMRRDFIPRAELERAGAALGMAIRKVIVTLHQCAPDFAGVTVEEADRLLKEREDELLEQLHIIPQQIKDLIEAEEDVEEVEPEAETAEAPSDAQT